MQSTWADGYPTDFGYAYGVFPELAPAWMQLALVNAGIRPPSTEPGFRYAELGFGQGVSLAVASCTQPAGEFFGNDFNPEHVQFARTLQAASGSRLSVCEDSFEALCRQEGPPFDFIVAHGIWSWVNPAQWPHLVRFVRERLRPGGVFQVSYNALPGWAKFMPMHDLIATVARLGMPPDIDPATRLARTLELVRGVVEQRSGYFEINAAARERFERLGRENPHYLAHEYLNEHWTPCHFHQVESRLREAKLSYACQADLRHHLDFLELGDAQRRYLAGLDSPTLRETVRDYLCNRQFRRDLYVKGPVRLSGSEQRERLLEFAFAPRVPVEAVELSVTGALGTAELDPALYRALLGVLARDPARALALHQLVADPALGHHGFDAIFQAVFLLVAKGDLGVTNAHEGAAEHRPAQALNAWIVDQATHNLGLPWLVDVVGGGVLAVEQVEQLFLHGRARGITSDDGLVAHAEHHLRRTGRRHDSHGELARDAAALRDHLRLRLGAFRRGAWPMLVARGVLAGH